MVSPKCQALLEELRTFGQVDGEGRSSVGWARPAQPGLEIADLVRLATALADEAGRVGLADVLQKRVTRFLDVTSDASSFGTARRTAQETLAAGLEAQADLLRPRGGGDFYLKAFPNAMPTGRMIEDCRGCMVPEMTYDNGLPGVVKFLSDTDRVRWHLPTALADADRMVAELQVPAETMRILTAWRRECGSVAVSAEREHLFGSYLLLECQAALASLSDSSVRYTAFLGRLADDRARFRQAMYRAAEDARLSEAREPNLDTSRIPAVKGPYHHLLEPRPNVFAFGPLAGTLSELAGDICPAYGKKKDRRRLRKLGLQGDLWLVQLSGQTYKVWFRDQRIYAECNGRQMRRNEQKGAVK
jgi:hypothetical protein